MNKDFEWFKNNFKSLYETYGTSFIVIKDKKVIGNYATFGEAVRETRKTEEEGTFIVQRCGDNESCFSNYISSMNFA